MVRHCRGFWIVVWGGLVVLAFLFSACDDNDETIIGNEDQECRAGLIWTQVAYNAPHLRDIVWTGSQFVAVGNMNVVKSTDGVEWTKTSFATFAPYRIAWSGSTLVIIGHKTVGSGQIVQTSSDGENWTEYSIPFDEELRAIVWAGDKFVAVGNAGVIVTSPDGVTWTERIVDYEGTTPSTLMCLGWSGSRLVALSSPDEPVGIKSNDGIEWSLASSMQPGYTGALDIGWNGSYFVSVGDDGQVMNSLDGSIWSQANSPTSAALLGITFTDDQCVAVGDLEDSGVFAEIMTSSTGAFWTRRHSGVVKRLEDAVFAPELCMWVAVGIDLIVVSESY